MRPNIGRSRCRSVGETRAVGVGIEDRRCLVETHRHHCNQLCPYCRLMGRKCRCHGNANCEPAVEPAPILSCSLAIELAARRSSTTTTADRWTDGVSDAPARITSMVSMPWRACVPCFASCSTPRIFRELGPNQTCLQGWWSIAATRAYAPRGQRRRFVSRMPARSRDLISASE